eukprot:scaffold3159_cov191-Alexandrium_tamarense.AAC.9
MAKKTCRKSGSFHSSTDNDKEVDQAELAMKQMAREHDTECLFNEYRNLLSPSKLFKIVLILYGERKLFIIISIHLIATLVIWGTKYVDVFLFHELEGTVPSAASYYWAKRVIPPLEFGSMHSILFQMALLPLSMSRYTIASLSNSSFDRFFPLNKMFRLHIQIGCEL